MTVVDLILILAIAGLLLLALRRVLKDQAEGKCTGCAGCSGGCGSCSSCQPKATKKTHVHNS